MNEVRKQLFLAAPIEKVWAFLTNPGKLAAWLMESDLTPVEGTRFTFTAEPSGAWDGKIYCEVLEVLEPERITYTWNANDINQETRVTIDLTAVTGGTRLTLVHAGLAGAAGGAAGRHAAGWLRALQALRKEIEGPPSSYDWSEFRTTYYVDAPLPDVFGLWSTAAGMQRFWADAVRYLDTPRDRSEQYQNGDRLHLHFPTDATTEIEIEILNIESNKFVLFAFGQDYGWVKVAFDRHRGRTRIILEQFGMPTADNAPWEVHANARGWWIANLINIKSVLTHGNDLRVRCPGSDIANGLGAQFRAPAGSHDWRSFDVYLYIDAAPTSVMRYWRTATGLQQFFIARMTATDSADQERDADDLIQSGDTYTCQWIHDFAGEGKILESTESRVEFTFGPRFTVEVDAQPAGKGALLHLRQSGMDDGDDDRVHGSLNCRSCWINFMVSLKSVIEHGVDMRDADPTTADSIAVGFEL